MREVTATSLNDRWDWVDSAKGIGIILVVYGHVARGLHNAGIYTDHASFTLIDSVIYSFHMPLFFFLSGIFCISSFEKRGTKLVFSKIDAIYYPYLIWSLIQGSIEIGMGGFTNQHASWDDLLNVVWQPRAQFWFLYTLFFTFVFNIIFLWVLERLGFLKKTWPFILLAFAMLLIIGKPLLPGLFFFQSVASYDIYFAFGAIFWLLHKNGEPFNIKLLVLLISLFVAMQYAVFIVQAITLSQSIVVILLAGLGISSVIGLAQRIRFFSVVGLYSMEIYLMHVIFGSGMRIVLQKGLHIEALAPHLIVGVVVGIALPILAARWMHRFKLKFLLRPPKMMRLGH